MASLKDTKRRIGSVKNTQKITRAMKLVASAKYAKANVSLAKARPYFKSFCDLVEKSLASGEVSSPLLEERVSSLKKVRLIIVSADRGLCGPLNSSVMKVASRFLKDKKVASKVSLELWGRRSVLFGNTLSDEILDKKEKVIERPNYPFAKKAFERLAEEFLSGSLDEVFVAYPSFQSALSQPAVVKPLLPLSQCLGIAKTDLNVGSCLFEPELSRMVTPLLTKFGAVTLYQFLLEAATAEHAARVAAMDSATTNANKVIKELTLQYNRARQASITKELIEITSGAEALN
jgi:F-type H+-transporting ATPase subunit gamma